MIVNKWAIPTNDLTSPRRTGGRTSIRGYAFQDAYACLQLACLLDPSRDLVAVRYEGAQDIDLRYADGREQYVQLKNEPDARYTLNKLAAVLQGFAIDLLDAGKPSTLTFIFVARSNSLDAATARLRDGNPTANDVDELTALFRSASASPLLSALSDTQLRALIEQLLRQIEFQFGVGGEIEGRNSFAAETYVRLAENGVAGADLAAAFSALKAALIPQRELTGSDVQEILKRFLGNLAIDVFEGRAQVLVDELLANPAGKKRIQQYYAGAPLDWDILAAHGDIPRDQQEELIEKLRQPADGLRLVCLVAEPGAGKSTLAWRAAVELHLRHGALVIRLRDRDEPDCWYQLEGFYQRVNQPFYVLADDLFRSPDVVSALCEVNPSLPITVLATSRRNEFRQPHFKGELVRTDLLPPSKEEKERLLERLGKSRQELTVEQQTRLDSTDQFLVLMMELTAGKELQEIVRDSVERLKAQDESAWRAYEYLCFVYKHSISIRESLLERLDEQGRFHKLPGRETTQGLIYYDDEQKGSIRLGHPVIADTACSFYSVRRAPFAVLQEIAWAVDQSDWFERRFFAHLLRVQSRTESSVIQSALPQIEPIIEKLRQSASISELVIWRTFYKTMGQREKEVLCVNEAFSRKPTSALDCGILLGFYRERGREQDALPMFREWIHLNPDALGALQPLLGLIERHGTKTEIADVIKETSAWLSAHDSDNSVRARYLGLVERTGMAEQVAQVVKETSAWLSAHDSDNSVRATYLGLVERTGMADQVAQVVKETSAWLSAHDSDSSVRAGYLGLVERTGMAEQVAQVVKETSAWLSAHDSDNFVRAGYLGLVERKGTAEQVAQVVKETSAWLSTHDSDSSVRAGYLGLVERKGTADQVAQVVKETQAWLAQHDSAKPVWEALIALLIRVGMIEEATSLAQRAIALHPHDQNLAGNFLRFFGDVADEKLVRGMYEKFMASFPKNPTMATHFAAWLRDHNHADEAEVLYDSLLRKFPRWYQINHGYGRLLLSLGKYEKAITQFRIVLKIHRGHQMAHDGLAQTLSALGKVADKEGRKKDADQYFSQAEREFREAIHWSKVQNQRQAVFYTNLGWFYLDWQRCSDAIEAFEMAMNEDSDYFGNYWGIGRAKLEQGHLVEALNYLRVALDKAPEDFQPPANEEISELIKRCEQAISSRVASILEIKVGKKPL